MREFIVLHSINFKFDTSNATRVKNLLSNNLGKEILGITSFRIFPLVFNSYFYEDLSDLNFILNRD